MEEQNKDNIPPKTTSDKKLSIVWVVAITLICSIVTGLVVYALQGGDENSGNTSLELSTQETEDTDVKEPEQVVTESTEEASTKYISKVGGLELDLPSKYTVIVNVDGNKGGAPGSTFRIAENEADGVVRDGVYEWVEIEIGHLSSTAQQQAEITKNQLAEDGYEGIVIADDTLNDLPSKVVTANGFGYAGQRKTIVVKSGEFIYTFTLNSPDITETNEMFDSVLSGSTITEKTLN